jgi:hypothetical protein
VTTLLERLKSRLGGGASEARIEALERLVRKQATAAHDDASALQAQLRGLTDAVTQQPTAKDLKELRDLRQTVGELRQSIGGLRDSVSRLSARVVEREDPLFAAGRIQLLKQLEKIASRSGPVLVGPWTGEVGYELLYWIPFLRWVQEQCGIGADRQVIVSRGGVGSWYGASDTHYTDVFSLVDGDEFRTLTAEQTTLKQQGVDPFHGRLVDLATAARGGESLDLLHPSLMFKALRQFWDDEAGYARIAEFTRPVLLQPPVADRPSGLPSEYVAVRFYFRRSFPDTPENRAFAQAVVVALASRIPVVLLTSGARLDDHTDWLPAGLPNVTVAASGSVERNLAVQSAVIGGARAFVGTYGGFSYLAPLYRVPAVAFYARRRFDWMHLYAAERAFETIGAAPLTLVQTSQASLVQSALAAVTGEPGPSLAGAGR